MRAIKITLAVLLLFCAASFGQNSRFLGPNFVAKTVSDSLGAIRTGSFTIGSLTVTGYTTLKGVTAQDSMIIGSATTDGGATKPVQVRKDGNYAVSVNLENQTAGTGALVSYRLESNSADAQLMLTDDGYTGVSELADNLVLFGNTNVSAVSVMASGAASTIKMYAGGTTATNLVGLFSPDSIHLKRRVRVDSTLRIGTGGSPINAFLHTAGSNLFMIVFDSATDTLFVAADSSHIH